jgi:hypothetical protein
MLRVSSAQSVRSRCFYPPSTLDITPNSIANTSIERAYVITWQESNFSQLLHLNFYFVTWNDNLCHLQLLTRWDNSQSIQPPLLNRTPILINMYFNEDQRTNTTKKHVSKNIRLSLQIRSTTLHSTVNTIGKTYVFGWKVNQCALSATTTKSGEVRFSIQFLLMLHRRFANARQSFVV